ncbi:ZPR1 zinc-finger domain-containing protein [Thamnocephalis sphaerospora]|uniref:ZPR1 zinc-finger domain-containing protein n=1 Tax=Thamnocephalis sphaerospora TaxID=78915 RepID=A0A4P9XRK2_9FUNG|nr:ZPR1 zinc-finger domain-containing protein [Thamnocephalis sphaerospora]|eukprot:RKP08715.1 ZPR1 zinc-finger domain-containing protein [Thamnocephalis sphaerospora]
MTDQNAPGAAPAAETAPSEPLFTDIDAGQQVTEMESYCMNCGENGITRLLLTRIPHFREVIVMAFECPHCHTRNSEIQSAGTVQELGAEQTCQISTREDLNRQLVKSDSAVVRFVEADMEIPAVSRRGALTTVEGLISSAIEDLSDQQPVRKHTDAALYLKIEELLAKLRGYLELKEPFTLKLDDPAGNSYIENLCAPNPDPKLAVRHYKRTLEQNRELSLALPEGVEPESTEEAQAAEPTKETEEGSFPAKCSTCNAMSDTRMHIVNIPYFKEVVIMSTACDECGYKSNEVKAGGPVSLKGRRISLKITDSDDLSRDILKSETCGLRIPEIDLELQPGTLGGRFTTVEGLLRQVYEELDTKVPFAKGDSAPEEQKKRFSKFLDSLNKVLNNEIESTLVLDDPLANSYLQNLYAPDPDPNMTIEDYERTWDQNEDLGLNDIKVEGYEQDAEQTAKSE